MPENGDDVQKWLSRMLLLLPGFLSVGLARYIGGIGDFDELELTLYSLTLSLVVFIVSLALYRGLRYSGSFLKRSIQQSTAVNYTSVGFGLLVLFVAVVLGGLAGKLYSEDLVLVSARKFLGSNLKMSSQRPLSLLLRQNSTGSLKEGRPPHMQEKESWLEIELEGGERFAGYPLVFRTTSDQSEIFLSPACRIKGTAEALNGPGILIAEPRVKYIVFSGRSSSDCYNVWENKQ
jgi:hypothetical protein